MNISNNRFLLYCDNIVVLSIRDTIINNFQTTIREVLGLPTNTKLYFARNIGMLGSGKNYWIDSASVNGIVFSNITDVKENYKSITNEFMLYQNYPNPFNPSTTIKYQIPQSGLVTIKVYNLLGKEVKTLVNQYQNTESHEVKFNAGNLPSGIYFYRLETSRYSKTKKLLLVK